MSLKSYNYKQTDVKCCAGCFNYNDGLCMLSPTFDMNRNLSGYEKVTAVGICDHFHAIE